MAYFEWNNDLSVGVDLFDSHHKKLVSLINELHNAMSNGKGKEVVADTVVELAMYTEYHFAEEELRMARANYPGLEAHKLEHAAFTRQVVDFIARLDAGSATLSIKMMRFLSHWLCAHIKKTDKKYAVAITNTKVA
ncbi:MAG: hemerythrin family protein [Proteobacteria bacterium]|nr:hemerythrin family protein [Pseudomonadota bacterium]